VESIGKEAVLVNDSPGFATSRLGVLLGLEAIRMVEEGVASAVDIDRAMELGYRHPMGPLRLTDLVGLDVRLDIARYLHEKLRAERFRPPVLLEQMVAEGRLGKKSGQGFYAWDAS
jgi:3-hydroxybutyryl-CoA dehydrogenase